MSETCDEGRSREAIILGVRPLRIADVVAVARHDAHLDLAPGLGAQLAAARAALEEAAARGDKVYGLTTGLGAAADTPLEPSDLASFQRRALAARMVGVGEPLSREATRALLLARLAGLAKGASGISPSIPQAIADLLNAGVTPVVPGIGSIGAADLAPLAHAFAVLIGEGEAVHGGRIMAGAEALAAAGLAPIGLGPKDALALINANSASVGPGALAVADAENLLEASLAALALGLEAFRGNLSPIGADAVALRRTPRLVEVSARLRALLAGSDLEKPGAARRLQDPLSFRSAAPILAALADALAHARQAVELEHDGAGDNPAITQGARAIVSTAGFEVTHLALAFETLGLALAQAAGASFWRCVKLMSSAMSGLPRFLTPHGGSRSGFSAVQKTAAALEAEIRRLAQPAMLFPGPVADGVEDMASMAPRCVAKTAEALGHMSRLVALELMVAAQALDLRGAPHVAPCVTAVHAKVRAVIPRLDEDRPTGPDIEALAKELREGRFSSN
ncbi:MAG: aromatic amino acid lyase [Hyphomicrobiales bacterium]